MTASETVITRFAEAGITLPTFAELADPALMDPAIVTALADVHPDAPHPLNLYRVHWHNDITRRERVDIPQHLVLPTALTGVPARIVVALGDAFPMIQAHKVLAAFGCLVPRLLEGSFDPTHHRAIWPSTGNYCRGGVAISRILGCRGVAVLPQGMSAERFDWLDRWVNTPGDIIRTPGTESNVKEIYDKCRELSCDPNNVVLNQFAELGNHLAHRAVTGAAMARIATHVGGKLAAFVAATGSAGTLAAGEHLAERFGSATVAVEALECPTLLYNGFGEHNIQGIGDKHVPLIHHVHATDEVCAVSEQVTDKLYVVLQSELGRQYLVDRRGVDPALVACLPRLGLSALCNVLASIKLARYHRLGPDDVVLTVATDSGAMYHSEVPRAVDRWFGGRFDALSAAEAVGQALLGAGVDHVRELDRVEKDRIFNLGYFTWVEQQGVPVAEFEARRSPAFWQDLRGSLSRWDNDIRALNAEVEARRCG